MAEMPAGMPQLFEATPEGAVLWEMEKLPPERAVTPQLELAESWLASLFNQWRRDRQLASLEGFLRRRRDGVMILVRESSGRRQGKTIGWKSSSLPPPTIRKVDGGLEMWRLSNTLVHRHGFYSWFSLSS